MQQDEVYRIDGMFEPSTAATLCAALRRIPAGTRIVLDFTWAREVSPAALWLVVERVPRESRVVLRGLPYDVERVLEHLGLPATHPDPG